MSALEDLLDFQLKAARLPLPERQYRFCPTRRWKADFAWPGRKLMVEVDGGIYVNGAHSRGAGIEGDMEKQNWATVEGWRVLRYSGGMVKKGIALQDIEKVLF